MATLEEMRAALKEQRASLVPEFQAAKVAGDTATMHKLSDLAGEIDDALDDLAMMGLAAAAARVAAIAGQFDALIASVSSWPFGKAEAPAAHERPRREAVPDNDQDDEGPAAPPPAPPAVPAPAPAPTQAPPAASPGWAAEYRRLWDTMTISADWQKKARAIVDRILANHARYDSAVAGTTVPWWFVAIVHAMECSLRFDQHLHNGDPLTARTVRVPRNRPPSGSAPFTWEQSASDAIAYERLTEIASWSLEDALFNWHRYNGINNEYKRRGIPTPYLWSGSQHYRKGKYVADGVFDPEAVSAQVGAAVLLRTLVDLKAVTLGDTAIESNPAAAAGNPAVLSIDTSGAPFAHVDAELADPGPLAVGAGKTAAEKKAVRRLQEWLHIHHFPTPIDGGFGDSTSDQLKAFQTAKGRSATGQLDPATWVLLTAPMRQALAKVELPAGAALEDAVVAIARQHAAQQPIEVGGNNCGPWVRLYMQGREGASQAWCAGFVCFVVAQAVRDLGLAKLPFKRQVWVPSLAEDAQGGGRFIAAGDVKTPPERASKLQPGQIFVIKGSDPKWTHTGFVLAVNDKTFDTIEGNVGGDSGINGPNAKQGNYAFGDKDFLRLM
ncbi:MAG: peptidoglycan-binding protein [Reyranellaceae bacterium]